jgi:hypothetical protein
MKNFTIILFLFICQYAHSQSIGIGSNNPPHPSAALDVNSTTKGFLVPRMTTAQRNAIATPSIGLQVFDTTTNSFWYFNGTAWTNVYVGNFSLPFSSTGSVPAPNSLFSIINTGGGRAIYGKSNTGQGIVGESTNDIGVRGESSSGFGVYGTSNSNVGVNGFSNTSYAGYFENNSNTSPTLRANNFGSGGAAKFIGKVEMTNNLIVDGSLTVNNDKGVVYNGTSSANLRIHRFVTQSILADLPAHGSDEVTLTFTGGFTIEPIVFVGNIATWGGASGEPNRVILQVHGCDYSAGTTTCTGKIVNTDNAAVDYSIRWNMLAIGN